MVGCAGGFLSMLTTQFKKERATRKKSILGKLTMLWIYMKSSTFAGITSNSSIIEISLFRWMHAFNWTWPLLPSDCSICTPISAYNDIMYAFLYLSDFLRRFSTRRTWSMYLPLTNFAIIDLGRVCGRVVITLVYQRDEQRENEFLDCWS